MRDQRRFHFGGAEAMAGDVDHVVVATALGDADDPYGGMGRNGARRTPEAEGRNATLTKVGQPLTLENGKVHNIESSA